MKIIFARYNNPSEKALNTMQRLFGIDASNSPNPYPDVMKEEPTLISVRESCQSWADIVDVSVLQHTFGTNTISEFVNKELLPYLVTFEFALSNTECLSLEGLAEKLLKTTLDISDDVATTMFLQAVLNHNTQSRFKINEKSVLDSETLHDLIRDLRMAIYFDLCKVKKDEWLKIIGDVTYAEALTADVDIFSRMIGIHTHGLSKDKFWAMLKASANDKDKYNVFLSKSNSTVQYCSVKTQ